MKKLNISSALLLSGILAVSSCSKFDEMGVNPKEASASQVEVEYFLNNSIVGAQMDPHIAERIFVIYWKNAGRQQLGSGISTGGQDDGYNTDYYRYISGWLNSAVTAIEIADSKKANGSAWPYNENLKQVARIWRAYLLSEMADNFGPIAINGFEGVNPDFADVKTVYYHVLDELKDASAKLDLNVSADAVKALDPAYGFNFARWQKYANSLRLRLAMRLSEVDAAKAKAEFEDAVTKPLLTTLDDAFQVQEKDGWSPLTGVMSRPWNTQALSTTLENLMVGLGGIKSSDQLAASFAPYIKPANYAGLQLLNHFSTKTNEPYAGFFLDGLPYTVDPRGYKAFPIPGDFNNPNFPKVGDWSVTVRNLVDDGGATVRTLEGANTWNGSNGGAWGAYGTRNQWRGWPGAAPRVAGQFRLSTNKRMFFGPWETYFLIAEAAVRNWTVPMTGENAYKAGVQSNFDYWGVGSFATAYLASEDYNRVGTSVSWNHVAEPAASYSMNYVNGYTNAAGTTTINYPNNGLYKNGTVKNDLLTKIITQKFIAQTPWLPLETWSDHRRLGLPFFENVNAEAPIATMPDLNAGNYMTSNIKFFPQRLKYPASLNNTNSKGYQQALTALGGADNVLTPLWWAKK
ncbi:MAG TPA: SusD/RagB family nutrient-binding outer membrane lipoprotein [Pseudobacter sp.]|nr:SusD/RagB family nutrient-binding outer membrane lipoprotein [Pseudobacter sp.]